MFELFILGLGGLFGYYLWDSHGAKESATLAARAACRERHLQFLDFSVVKLRTGINRNQTGQPQWQRIFSFEFTVGSDERYNATIELRGKQLYQIDFEAHPMPDDSVTFTEGPGRCPKC